MFPVLAFDIETVPDISGLRRLHGFPEDMTDAEVAQAAFLRRRQAVGTDFLPLHLHRVIAVACALRDRNQFIVWSLGDAQGSESDLLQRFFDGLERYTPQSRWVQSVDTQLAQLNSAKANFSGHFNGMPASERQSVDLLRAQKVAETIYLGMVQKAEQLQVRRASTTGGAHIVDQAITPHRPVKPQPILVLPGGLALGIVSGIVLVFMRRHVLTGVTDPLAPSIRRSER